MRKNSSFTLVELLIAIIILAILAAIAIPIYQNTVEQRKIEICTANQEALLEAVKIYDMENDALPSSLAKVWRKNGEEALAIVWERKKKEGDYTYLAYISFQKFRYFLANIFSINPLYAQPSFSSTLADKGMLRCPSDPNGPPSYAINRAIVNRRWDPIRPNTDIIADSDESLFTRVRVGTIGRHRGRTIVASRNGMIRIIARDGKFVILRPERGTGERGTGRP